METGLVLNRRSEARTGEAKIVTILERTSTQEENQLTTTALRILTAMEFM